MSFTFPNPPQPFKVEIPQADIDDLRKRLENARWPVVDTVPDDKTDEEKSKNFGMGHGELVIALVGRGSESANTLTSHPLRGGAGLLGPTLPLMKEWAEGWKNHSWEKAQEFINQ